MAPTCGSQAVSKLLYPALASKSRRRHRSHSKSTSTDKGYPEATCDMTGQAEGEHLAVESDDSDAITFISYIALAHDPESREPPPL